MIPLSLYIHLPWCVQKCPYCDFNSHQWQNQQQKVPDFEQYIDCLLADFEQEKKRIGDRSIHSIFIGGGTPSLFPIKSISRLLYSLRDRVQFEPNLEITIESNPNSADHEKFEGYIEAGINRISIGVQSFNSEHLKRLGRVHSNEETLAAIALAKQLPLRSFNLDLMHGLPDQTLEQALTDLKTAIAFDPPHLSWYQLTIEPNTLFGSKPPILPDDDELWDIYEQGHQLLKKAGYIQYETSAYSKPDFQCQHNLNYWRYGDYIGIGCGAHGKVTLPFEQILRTVKTRHPAGYLQNRFTQKEEFVTKPDRPFEFFMNQFRLFEKAPKQRFIDRTFLPLTSIGSAIQEAVKQNYLIETEQDWQLTEKGKLFLNSLLMLFMD